MIMFGWLVKGFQSIRGIYRDVRDYFRFRRFVKIYEDEPNSAWYQLKLHRNKISSIVYRNVDMPVDWEEYQPDNMKMRYIYDNVRDIYEFFVENGWGEYLTMEIYKYFDIDNPENKVYTYRVEFVFRPMWIDTWKSWWWILRMLLILGVIACGVVFVVRY